MDNEGLPKRKKMRAEFHDYCGGVYFVTICTLNRKHYFGEIYNHEMHFSHIGHVAKIFLESLSSHYQYAEVPLFTIMPNHIHAIISIRKFTDETKPLPSKRNVLSVIVAGYKQAVTRYAHAHSIEFEWQKRYFDHIIRGDFDGNPIAEYIENNVAQWAKDRYSDM